jgi:putative transposase
LSRKPRVEYQGAIFHVIQRGNNKETIFPRDRGKIFFLQELKSLKKVYNFRLLGYVLLNNHYHLIIQTLDDPLQKIMHRLNSTFAHYFNFFQERSGHVFQGRYKAILVLEERYLFALLRYIHQNPVRAGICDSVDKYPWSSDESYRRNNEDFVDIQIILDMFNGHREKALHNYCLFMAEKELDLSKEFEEVQLIGETKLQTVVENNKAEDVLSSSKRKGLDDILKEAVPSLEEFQLIKEGSRLRKLTPFKKEYVRQARSERYTLEEIGNNINLSQVAILKMV